MLSTLTDSRIPPASSWSTGSKASEGRRGTPSPARVPPKGDGWDDVKRFELRVPYNVYMISFLC